MTSEELLAMAPKERAAWFCSALCTLEEKIDTQTAVLMQVVKALSSRANSSTIRVPRMRLTDGGPPRVRVDFRPETDDYIIGVER